jgi:uncharacterized repeat protein (TIGR01451 family)
MKGWQRSARRTGLALFFGLIFALAVLLNRGQTQSVAFPPCSAEQPGTAPVPSTGEPPLAGSTAPPKTPLSPTPPFTAPPPTPLAPDEIPYFPGIPFTGTEPADPPMPMVRLRVRAPAEVQPDKDIEYRLTVENVSRANAHHVIVRDRLPAGTQFVRAKPEPTKQAAPKEKGGETDLLWDFGTLKPGERKVIVLFMNPSGTGEVKNSAYVQFEQGQTVATRIARPRLQVRATAPAQAFLHDSITFRLEIANTGSTPARDVVVTDELPAGLEFVKGQPYPKPEQPLTWKLGNLAPGQTRRIEYQAISKQTGTFANKVEVKAAGGVHEIASARVVVGEAKLSILKTGPRRRLVNRAAPYQITVSNSGTLTAMGVQVLDELPAGIELLHASAGGRVMGGQVRWALGPLPAGEKRSLQVIVRASRPGRFGNMVQVQADHNLSAKSLAEETRFETASGPAVEIDKSADPLEVGQKGTYTIRLINPEKTAFLRPRLLVTVPGEMTVLGSRGPTTAQRDGQIVRFDPLPALDAGKEAIYTVEVEARKPGEVQLRVELADDRTALGPPRLWDEKTIIREAAKLVPRPAPPTLQVRQSHRN